MTNPYISCVKSSEKSAWVLDEILPESHQFDMSRHMIPLTGGNGPLKAFSPDEIRLLSHLLAGSYTYLIDIIEEFIVDLVTREISSGQQEKPEAYRLRAISRFLDEELKHQQLFQRFNENLARTLGTKLVFPDTRREFSSAVMKKSPLSIWMLTLQAELLTQNHYNDIFKSSVGCEPKFVEMLKFHWLEEAQHVRIDLLEVDLLVKRYSQRDLEMAFSDFVDLQKRVDEELFHAAIALIENFRKISGRSLDNNLDAELGGFLVGVFRSFLINSGVMHPVILKSVKAWNLGLDTKLFQVPALIVAEGEGRLRKAA